MATLTWLQFGDLHVCEGDDWRSLELFSRLVDEANRCGPAAFDFAVLPGDNANHATDEQFRRIAEVAGRLQYPLFVLPGDHDFERGSLDGFRAHLAPAPLPRAETIAGARCLLLDVVSAGSGGPDFRLGGRQTAWLRHRLLEEVGDGPTLVFMHAFPCDLTEGGAALAEAFAEAGIAYVGTGHTHYNDLLNDGHVIYGATRSTGEIEEPGGAGFSISALDGDVVSWRFKALETPWPFVLITSPSDHRLATNIQSRRQVPDGGFEVRARVIAATRPEKVEAQLDGGQAVTMTSEDAHFWIATFDDVPDGLHRLDVTAHGAEGASNTDRIEVLVRRGTKRPKRRAGVALGHDVHSIRLWPEHGIPGGQLGPNRNGRKW